MEITFLGAAGTVTGSKHLIKHKETQVLIDCGLYQGLKEFRLMNWEEVPVDLSKLDAIILTHAHLDHCGYLPRIVKGGFKGFIYGTEATIELTKVVLLDAAKIQEEDASHANKHGFSKHHPALPLYDRLDVERMLHLLIGIPFNSILAIKDLKFNFTSAGHILGAASVTVSHDSMKVLFSGDIGRKKDPLMPPPASPPHCDVVVMESTYGDRIHQDVPSKDILTETVNKITKTNGVLLIPAFAIGRSQNLLVELVELRKEGKISSDIPIYLNTPMGQEVTNLYKKYVSSLNISSKQMHDVLEGVKFVNTAEESKSLNQRPGPMIVVAASGMLTGGRVLYHLESFAGDKNNIILLAGFQGPGTRGWALANGCKEIKVHGKYIPIVAQVLTSDAFSAHADQTELLEWLKSASALPKKVFLVHGEPAASSELANRIRDKIGITAVVPKMNQCVSLD